jgi:hypothetical protein
VSGIAAGASALYVTADSCSKGFQFAKSDTGTSTKLSSFSITGSQSAGAACDNVTFVSTTAMWVRDAATGHLRAIEVPAGTCVLGGGIPIIHSIGWMSGSGKVGVIDQLTGLPVCCDVQHAFHLLCALSDPNGSGAPNNLVANWRDPVTDIHYSFHLETLTDVHCVYSETGSTPNPPPTPSCTPTTNPSCFDTIYGEGKGRLIGSAANGSTVLNDSSGVVDFRFTDRGEPNVNDDGNITVMSTSGNIVSPGSCVCTDARYQAHQSPH